MPSRPLSPHLSVYKFKYTLVSSILNRFTGAALSVGFIVLVAWIFSVANGPQAQAHLQWLLGTPPARVFLAAMVISFCYHLVAGIRHLVWDTGRGLERATSQKSAWFIGILSVLLMLLVFYCIWAAP
ncbi:MAG: succinate dehydrogenase, cytochrome b556 subunit [Proteobacteria bacterium]|nr:succinate dehydrogenase, cytochrome b556 subunit [Pseudomonadota bacterium]